jgi:glycosyltransferase involved in cell wall biosynthesis
MLTMTRLLIILPTHGHGGCEYNALSFARFATDVADLSVSVAMPLVAQTTFLHDLARENGLRTVDLGLSFEADDDEERLAAQARRVVEIVHGEKPDVVFLALPWPARGAGLIVGLADAGIPALVKFALVPEILYGPPQSVLPALRRAVAGAQIWFANSGHSARLVEHHFGLQGGVVEHFPVGPIGLAVLRPAPTVDRDTTRRALAIPEGALVVATVGRLTGQKGWESYLKAVPDLASRHPALVFLWVGEGDLRPILEATVDAAGLRQRVRMTGFQTDVRSLLAASDVFVLPSLYEGGSSQALLEAMDEGVACAASALPGVLEVVREGVDGLLFPPGDHVAIARQVDRLLTDPKLRGEVAERGRERVRAFTGVNTHRQTVERVNRLLATKLHRPYQDHSTCTSGIKITLTALLAIIADRINLFR